MKYIKTIIVFAVVIFNSCSVPETESILIEAESFDHKGGWVVDPQFMDQMGSPYLMAHGLGKPVKDALTIVEFPQAGEYHVYVRTWNWNSPWDPAESPGIFQLMIDDRPVDMVFGKTGDEWSWIYGGMIDIKQSQNRIALHDLIGFNGRCDAILFTKDTAVNLPNNDPELYKFRQKLLNIPDKPANAGDFDLVVVGGGIAGICSAVSAARLGLKVALIQNRPVLGGNNSSEIRVHLGGSTRENMYPELGEIVRDLDTGDPGNAGPAEAYGDQHKLNLVRQEKNIKLFLSTHVFKALLMNGQITSVTGRNIETNEELEFHGRWFADCTGDGNLGYIAGADFAYGRESEKETGEFMAGRCISVTHVALGTIRVMRTGGMMGEVVGMAASICKEHKTNPRSVYENYLEELKILLQTGVGK